MAHPPHTRYPDKSEKTNAALPFPREIVYIGYIGGLGGEATALFDLAAGVAAQGWKVTAVVPDLPAVQEMAGRYQRAGMNIIATSRIEFDTGMQKPWNILRLHHEHRASVWHIHTGDIAVPRMNLLGLEAIRPRRVIATIHAAYPEMPFGGGRARFWASSVRRRLDAVICPSRHGRETQIRYGLPPEKAVTIYNGVDLKRFAAGKGGAKRAELNLPAEAQLVIVTARLHPQKRPQDALDAFAQVAPNLPHAHLIMVGAGPLEEAMKTRAQSLNLPGRIHFVGHRSDIPDWLAAADVWLCTSDAENFSIGVLEAMAAGCPIVATLCSGNDEALEPEINALTAQVGDVQTLATGIARFLKDAELRRRLGKTAQQMASRFSREATVERHISVYEGRTVSP